MTMNRIVMHHSGGPGTPTATDRAHYHRIADAGGKIHDGEHPISANAPGKPKIAGRYAAHTAGLNTGAIGIAMAAMGGAVWGDPAGSTRFFPTPAQVEAFIREVARLCRVYAIAVTPETVLTHAEVQGTLGVRQKNKWDFDYDLFDIEAARSPRAIGDELRRRIRDEMAAQIDAGRPVTTCSPDTCPVLSRGARGEDVARLQRALGLSPADGLFGPATEAALVRFQTAQQLRPDGVAGRMTWAALLSETT